MVNEKKSVKFDPSKSLNPCFNGIWLMRTLLYGKPTVVES